MCHLGWLPREILSFDNCTVDKSSIHLGFLGKNMQRIFNRFWNYVAKGFIGTVAICTVYPAACLIIPTVSFILGVLSPIWYVI